MVDLDAVKFVGTVIFVVWVCLFALIAGLSGGEVAIRNDKIEQVTGVVGVSEQSNLFGEHTEVTFQTLGGAEVRYSFIGYYTFELGKAYTISCIDRAIVFWFGPFVVFCIRGEITSGAP